MGSMAATMPIDATVPTDPATTTAATRIPQSQGDNEVIAEQPDHSAQAESIRDPSAFCAEMTTGMTEAAYRLAEGAMKASLCNPSAFHLSPELECQRLKLEQAVNAAKTVSRAGRARQQHLKQLERASKEEAWLAEAQLI